MLPNSLTDNNLTGKSINDDWEFGPLEIPPTQEPFTNNDSPSASSSDNTETRRYPHRSHKPVKRFELVEL